VARSKNTPSDKARQAILKSLKGAVKEQKKSAKSISKKASKLSRAWQRTRAAAVKQAKRNKDKDLVAQWRALRRLGYYTSTDSPAQSRLTSSRKRAIASAYKKAQSDATFRDGRTVRPLERTVKTVTTHYRRANGDEYSVVKQSIHYDLGPNFKFIKPKRKVKLERGIVKTRKGYVVPVESKLSRIRVKKSGAISETTDYKSGKITISREGITGPEILALIEKIDQGKFHIPEGSALKLDNFGTWQGQNYQWDHLDQLSRTVRYYENSMPTRVFEQWMDTTELHIVTVTPQQKIQ
jgi:hypothetical protein